MPIIPINPTERTVCNKVFFDFDAIVAPVKMGKAFVQNSTSAIQALLNTTVFATEAEVNQAITEFGDRVQANLPNTSDLESFSQIVRHCKYLHDIAPAAIMASAIDSAITKIDTLADEVSVAGPEFNMGKLASSINDLLFGNIPGSSIVSDLMKKGDKIITCLESWCGGEYDAQTQNFIDTMNYLYEDLNIISDPIEANYGTYDMDSLYAGAGISPSGPVATNINNVTAAQDGAKSEAVSKLTDMVDAIKPYGFGQIF